MAYHITISGSYGTHLPCLIKAMSKITGDVLELGTGVFSTPYLHYQCMLSKRKLVSYENFNKWYRFLKLYKYDNPYHEVNFIDDFAKADIDKPWDVVLLDQTPDISRSIEAKRLKDLAKYIIIHDTMKRKEAQYGYDKLFPLFKYKTEWLGDDNPATVLSNLVDLKDFWL
jgi:hypothetical protein